MLSRNELLGRIECLTPDGTVIVVHKPPRIAVCEPSLTSDVSLQSLVQRHVGVEFHATHRLDRDTTGPVLFGATSSARRSISTAFAGRRVKKKYVAVVHGKPCDKIAGCICGICPDDSNVRISQQGDGKVAASGVEVVRTLRDDYSLVEIRPITGRQHQIRLHLGQVIGHPIVGDTAYYPEDDRAEKIRAKDSDRQPPRVLLHSTELRLPFRDEILSIQSALAPDFQKFVDSLL